MPRRAAPQQPATLLGWMEALADPTRLRLLRLLERHELGVVELCDVLQLPQSTVSRHLKILADGGWVRSRRQGTTRLYRTILDELDPPTRKLWLLAREQTESWATVHQDALRLTRRLREREQDAQQFFAGAAGQWDKLRRDLYGEHFIHDAMLALLPSDYTVADLGCGTGHLAAELAPRVRTVIGIDNSPAMLKAARKRVADLTNVDLRQGDLETLPIADATCDAATLILVLTYATDPPRVLAEMSRILKPNGRAVVVDLLPHDRDDFRRQMGQQHAGFDAAELTRMLTAAGFTSAIVHSLPPEPEAQGPALFLATAMRG
jgi:ArsR family transcriptional regulator